MSAVVSRADPQETQILDPTTLDSNLTYRWVHNIPMQVAKRKSQGYRLVSRKEDKVKTLIDNGAAPDDFIYNGDSVLMCCSTLTVRSRRARTEAVSEQRLGAPVAQFRTEHSQSGARNSRVLVDEEGER